MKLARDPKIVYIKSDRYFNDPDNNTFFDGTDQKPVDAFGGLVPEKWQSGPNDTSNLKDTERSIRQRFQLDPFNVHQGGGK